MISLSKTKERFEKIRSGDKRSRDEFFLNNVKLVHKIANWYFVPNSEIGYEDLFQEGCIGLNKAINKFNPDLGFQFSTYAVPWIRQSIQEYVNDTIHMVHVSNRLSILSTKIKQYIDNMGNLKNVTIKDLADKFETSEKSIEEALEISKKVLSFDVSSSNKEGKDSGEGTGINLADIANIENYVHPMDELIDIETKEILIEALSTLSAREEQILRLHFGLGVDFLASEDNFEEKYVEK